MNSGIVGDGVTGYKSTAMSENSVVHSTESDLPEVAAFGRIMAIDLGEKRIGIALSDPAQQWSKSYGVIKRTSRAADFNKYKNIITEQKVVLVVMGLPLYLDGTDSDQTRWVRHYSAELAQQIDVPLVFHDETNTTIAAKESMQARGLTRKKRKQQVDAVAAALILESYLEDRVERKE